MANASPVCFLCSSDTDLQKLIDASSHMINGENFLLLTGSAGKIERRLAPAYLNAITRYRDFSMRSTSLQLEMLLFISGTMRISEAIKASGAKSSSGFIVFSTDKKLLSKFLKENKVKTLKQIKIILDPEEAQEVAMTELLSEK